MFKKIIKIIISSFIALFALSIIVVILFRFIPLPTSSFMIQQWITNLFDENSGSLKYDWVRFDDISDNIKLAVIAAEDQKFIDHFGFDLDEIEKAFEQNKRKKRIRGASTITQQTAKNIFLWSGKSYIRKGLEVYFTILLELFWSKKRILEVYLNIAEMGKNIYGVGAASKYFYKINPKRLNIQQSSLLAASLPNPKRYNIKYPSIYVQRRAAWIQIQMRQLGREILSEL